MPILVDKIDEVSVYAQTTRQLSDVLANPKLIAAMNELVDSPKARQEVDQDPDAFLKSRGVVLPPGAKATVTSSVSGVTRSLNITICFSVVINGHLISAVCLTIDSSKGISITFQ